MLEIKNLVIKYTNSEGLQKKILNDICCILEPGRITTFIGKSGAGKSSLLSCIAQLQNYEGLITYNQKSVKELSCVERVAIVGFIAQQFNLFTNLTCLKNCIQPMQLILKISYEDAYAQVMEIFKKLEIVMLAEKYPWQLSGGEQQRVAIARALCFNPKALLFDEPTSALDPEMSAQIAVIIQELARNGVAIGVVSHDISFIKTILDKIYFVKEGTLVESFDKNIHTDKNKNLNLINKFLNSMNLR